MPSIPSVTLEAEDTAAAARFYATAFDLDDQVHVRPPSDAASIGFRGFTLSLMVPRPADVDRLVDAAVDAGASPVKPVSKSMWGYGGVVRAPDGSIWKVATAAKKDSGAATGRIDTMVLLLGAGDVLASKRFYVEHGFTVAKSFGRKYVEFDTQASAIKLALYGRRALAKDAGVAADGAGSHRLAIDTDAGPFTDPDGFLWQTTSS